MPLKPALIPNIDFYINSDGNLVFTEKYHLKRGYCCQSGCQHCPYDYKNKIDPNIPAEFSDAWATEDISDEDDY